MVLEKAIPLLILAVVTFFSVETMAAFFLTEEAKLRVACFGCFGVDPGLNPGARAESLVLGRRPLCLGVIVLLVSRRMRWFWDNCVEL